ncbi:fatty acid synthase alpha subunit Lsd1 [Coemansia sp. RSA 2131]|nr:fatty acid synthase alpha subunit Lsd1 [Coemansia sp. RSA 2131]
MATVAIACGPIAIHVPQSLEEAEDLAAEYTAHLADASPPDIVAHAQFIAFCAQRNQDVAAATYDAFNALYCTPQNLHISAVVEQHTLNKDDMQAVFRGYWAGWALAQSAQTFDMGGRTMLGIFGGACGCSSGVQSMRIVQLLLNVYTPLISNYVALMSGFLARECQDEYIMHLFPLGFNVVKWATSNNEMPSAEYLNSLAVSMPLQGLVQLMRVAILAKSSGLSIDQLLKQFTAVSGHSHGLIIAAAVASAADDTQFTAASESALGWMMLFGSLPQIVSPQPTLHPLAVADSPVHEGQPSPMAIVQGVPRDIVSMVLQKYNAFVKGNSDAHVYLSVTDTADQFVISGNITSLVQVIMNVRRKAAAANEDQSQVPFLQRKPEVTVRYINTRAPLHCVHSTAICERHIAYASAKGWTFAAEHMLVPVRSGESGNDVRQTKGGDVTRYLAESVYVRAMSWPKVLACPNVTHVVDFAPVCPADIPAIGNLRDRTWRCLDGRGIALVSSDTLGQPDARSNVWPVSCLYSNSSTVDSWQTRFGPALVRTRADSVVRMDTRLQRLTGLPPVMISGLAPTTSHSEFIAAASHAGYLAELSIHDICTEDALIQRVSETARQIQRGHSIVLNGDWAGSQPWLIRAVQRMCQDLQLPILGLTLDDAPMPALAEAVQALHAMGLQYVALKPQTVRQIHCVLDIADRVHPHPVVLQWFGGRTGGHHSFEEFHMPIIQTYSAIRSRSNIVLVAGSGFGDAAGVLPYMEGSWGEMVDCAPMPFDGVLLRSRVMVAREAFTPASIKQLIVQASGIDPYDLPALFNSDTKGITSIVDHNGRPMHVIANRAALLCKDLNKWVFSQPLDKQPALLQTRKAEIISRLNADYMRPWFGLKRDGSFVDLEDMTYAETIDRLVSLMHQQGQWLHPSYRNFVAKFSERAAMRLHAHGVEFVQPVPRTDYDPVLDEIETIKHCYRAHVDSCLLASEDIQFFLALCTRSKQKAVPFVPVMDHSLATYMMFDALAQMEHLDSVSMDDAEQRVLIPQGAVSAAYSTQIDQPLAEIMNGINQGVVQGLLAAQYGGDTEAVPVVAYIGDDPPAPTCPVPATILNSADSEPSLATIERTYELPVDERLLPDAATWASVLSGSRKCWLHAMFMATKLVHGVRSIRNYLPQVLRPRAGCTFTVRTKADSDEPTGIEVFNDGRRELDMFVADGTRIVLSIYHSNAHVRRAIVLEYAYHPETPLLPVHEVLDGRDERVRQFFVDMWLHSVGPDSHQDANDDGLEFATYGTEITSDKVSEYCRATGLELSAYPPNSDQANSVPMDYIPVLALPSMFKALTSQRVHSDLLHMVQTTNHIELKPGMAPIAIGDIVDTVARITEISSCASGKRVVISALVQRSTDNSTELDKQAVVATAHGTFVFLGASVDSSECFRHTTEPKFVLELESDTDLAVFESKDWFEYLDGTPRLQLPCRLEFSLESEYVLRSDDAGIDSARTTGSVHLLGLLHERTHIGCVDFASTECVNNPVVAYLESRAAHAAPPHMFDNDGYALTPTPLSTRAPPTAHAYSRATNDYNPHNTNPYVADLTGLPGPLMQGHWTSAAIRQLIEVHVGQGNPTRVRSYSVNFAAIVEPHTELSTRLFHIGMHDGHMLVRGETRSTLTEELVLTCTARVAQPKTVYVFTGQGSQEPGMCMDLYARSAAARAVCDRADAHMRERFGFSILDIIRDNPKQYTVHFGGPQGAQIRKNYMLFTRRVDPASDAQAKHVPLFPEITRTSRSYTFRAPTGLLHATQFAQPAIMLFDVAVTAEMRSHGVFVEDAVFAGHSLGEYGALAAFKMMTLEDIIDITFIRGMTMQSTVERDAEHNSDFAMCAVNPSRVQKSFDELALANVIEAICQAREGLLEIVNYNVRQFQYVVAGTRAQLVVLGHVLDFVHTKQLNVGTAAARRIIENRAREAVNMNLGSLVVRTRATIPIPGIDVPFHSSHLLAGASQFRSCINMMIRETSTDCASFVGRYIPNLTARPFDITREYFVHVHEQTRSPVIARELDTWVDQPDCKERSRLARLMVIELLSYQFASPVKWIETQDRLFGEFAIEQIIEIGPSATLCRMAEGSLMIAGLEKQVAVKHIFRDQDDIYYTNAILAAEENAAKALLAAESIEKQGPEPVQKEAPESVEKQPPVVTETPPANQEQETASPDVPLTAVDVVRVVIAQKTKRTLDEIPADKTVKDLTGGKSTLQNEILGDLLKEFGASAGQIPDRPDEMPLHELAVKFGALFAGTLGSHTSAQVSRMFSTKIPGSMSQTAAREWLAQEHGLHKAHQHDSVFLVALTMEPTSRLDSTPAATEWLSRVACEYARLFNVTLATQSSKRSAGGSQNSAASSMISSAELKALQLQQHSLAMQQLEVYARHLGLDLRSAHRKLTVAEGKVRDQQLMLDAVDEELGQDFVAGIRGVFDMRKARKFDSHWNWAREDAYAWISSVLVSTSNEEWCSPRDDVRLHMLVNRTDSALIALLNGLVAILSKSSNDARALKLAQRIRDACLAGQGSNPVYREHGPTTRPVTQIGTAGKIDYAELEREVSFVAYVDNMSAHDAMPHPPLLHLREKTADHNYELSAGHSSVYYAGLRQMCHEGVSFSGYTALVTGCSQGSIAAHVIEALLTGGARVIATTSSYRYETVQFYEHMYKKWGARGSELILVPFNQGSTRDIRALVAYVFETLECNVDFVLPFAAISEYGSDVSALNSRSELASRIMLTNVLRLLGEIKRTKDERGMHAQPTLAVLPLSPNHGVFGFDGMYGESKAALETVFNRWHSEQWGSLVSVAGAKIGWTRGTGLMSANNSIAQSIESHGTRTFSPREMAFNIVGLLLPDMADIAQNVPLWADLNGGLQRIRDVGDVATRARLDLQEESSRRRAVVTGYGTDFAVSAGHAAARMHTDYTVDPLFCHQTQFASPRSYNSLGHLRHLQGTANLDKVVVVTGYGEVGPYGHAETRWEMEAFGEFSLEACVELAWVMGLIKHHNGELGEDQHYTGWVDAVSGEPVKDMDVKPRYEKQILEHTGIRLLEPALLGNQDPSVVPLMRELQIEHDMEPFEASADEAAAFKLRNNDKVDVWETAEGSWHVRFLKGAVLMVPKALRFDRLVGAQLPTGWDPRHYGISEDVIQQVDPVTCYALVATVEALVRSGITDPYELYAYFHVSEVGTAVGSGAGGVHAIRDLYRNRLTDKPVASDILQETFVNTTPAWINMLLLSSAGAIKPPTGGCGTSVLSIDVAADTIRAGKARVMLAGGFEGFVDQGSYEFAQMGATSNTVDEFACGREPREMSRPTTTTRTGFVEAQGAGIVVLMSAKAAIEFGAPIYGIVAYSGTATDKQGSSLPAPGMGVLTSARHSKSTVPMRIMDSAFRKRQIDRAFRDADRWSRDELEALDADAELISDPEEREQFVHVHRDMVANKLQDTKAAALDTWGSEFWRTDPRIAPLQGSLAAWGLQADDIGAASFHGTGTYANDLNEARVLDAQLKHLGRTPGHAVHAVCQKHLTGHPKGPAAAWMLNGALQMLRSGIVPGNHNADNIDAMLQLEHVLFPARATRTNSHMRAVLLKSFGFGQVGAEILVVHPEHVLATLSEDELDAYNQKLRVREKSSYRFWQDSFVGNHAFVQVKHAPPFDADQEQAVYLDPLARVHQDPVTGQYHF